MKIYTIQMAKWRKAKELGIELIDTTVKSGLPAFAPSWDIVLRVKQAHDGNRVEEERIYTEAYTNMMRASFRDNPNAWFELLTKESVAVACYCPAGCFCHRHLLVKFLLSVAATIDVSATYAGEIT